MADDGINSKVGQIVTASQWMSECDMFATPSGSRIAYRRRGRAKRPTVLMLHGFPTWSYDFVEVAADLESDFDVVTIDFLGYGASDKPAPHRYSVADSADVVEQVSGLLQLADVHLIVHDYGGIVGQELLDRHRSAALAFSISSVTVLNSGIVYSAYRPTTLQKMLARPVIGKLLASRVTAASMRAGLNRVRGDAKLSDAEFAELWAGISREDGQKLANLLIRYNAERRDHHVRWEQALQAWDGPLHLIWGTADPVSGQHVLDEARKVLRAKVTPLAGVGHFPQSEAPHAVAHAIRSAL